MMLLRCDLRLVRTTSLLSLASVAGALVVVTGPVDAQTRAFAASYGVWWAGDSTAATFSAVVRQPLFGPFSYSIGFTHLDDAASPASRTNSGAQFGLGIGQDGRGLYATGVAGAGVLHRTREFDALWYAGLGYAVRPLQNVSLALEAGYRTEDRDMAGFWRLHPDDRRGPTLSASLSIGLGGSRSTAPRPAAAARPDQPPSADDIHDFARERGASGEAARVTTSVVETALGVMGTPYRWGGSTENGFDCSGLIQYAYGQHGIILPRVSRDQMRMGSAVSTEVDGLRPGDLLGFSVERTSTITHIGLYIGDGQFIHSASDGVKLSSLTAGDPDSQWWQRRWVAARRIVD